MKTGRFTAELWRGDSHIGTYPANNQVTIEGKNHALDVMFRNATQSTTWYIGLIKNAPEPELLETDQANSHAGWVEFTSYTGNRQEWAEATAADGKKTTTTASSFSITDKTELAGFFVIDDDAEDSGNLWATALFDDPIPVKNGDTLKVKYEIDLNK